MIRSSRFLTLALGAVLTAGLAADDRNAPFAEALRQLGDSVAARPQEIHDSVIMAAAEDVPNENPGRNRVEKALGAFLVRGDGTRPVPADFNPAPAVVELPASAAPERFPETTIVPESRAVPLGSMLAGDDLGNHNRVHDFLTRPPSPRPGPDASAATVIAADFFSDSTDSAATVQLSDEQLPPPPPPAGPIPEPESPPAAVPIEPPESPSTPPPGHLSAGFIDPRYQLSDESSIYTSTCERCGRLHCYCVYAPFGEALRTAFGQQIHLGSAELMTLYAYDFHPQSTPLQSRLSSRGEYQLDKIVSRLQYTPAPIRIQATGNDALDAARRIRVLEALGERGISDADGMVVTVRARTGRPAIELLETSSGLLDAIIERGRTIQDVGGARFGQ